MHSCFVLFVLLYSVYGFASVKQSVGKGKANVCLKVEPKYYDLKDYVDILTFTMNLLEKNKKQSVYKAIKETKHQIYKALIKPKTDCKSYYESGIRKDGIYRISPRESAPFYAYCDMTNGGWTVIQRRTYGNVPFNRKWATYVEGFGNLNGDHWIGNEQIHQLTSDNPSQISFEFVMASDHANATAIYNGFYIDDERAQFRMHVKPNAKYNKAMKKYIRNNGFYYHNNMKFSTIDRDNDLYTRNCAASSGYWYKSCESLAFINGGFNFMSIHDIGSFKVIKSEVKIRRPA